MKYLLCLLLFSLVSVADIRNYIEINDKGALEEAKSLMQEIGPTELEAEGHYLYFYTIQQKQQDLSQRIWILAGFFFFLGSTRLIVKLIWKPSL